MVFMPPLHNLGIAGCCQCAHILEYSLDIPTHILYICFVLPVDVHPGCSRTLDFSEIWWVKVASEAHQLKTLDGLVVDVVLTPCGFAVSASRHSAIPLFVAFVAMWWCAALGRLPQAGGGTPVRIPSTLALASYRICHPISVTCSCTASCCWQQNT